MHKIFAKTLFLGKNLIYLPHCHSTNEEMQNRVRKGVVSSGDIVMSDYQSGGRGQRGNSWQSEEGKNILASVLLDAKFLEIGRQPYLTFCLAIAITETMNDLCMIDCQIKWPNDVFVYEAKIAGILTECSIVGNQIESAVVGIGVNLNQRNFGLLNATSVILETGRFQPVDSFLEEIVLRAEKWLLHLKNGNFEPIIASYYSHLRWFNELHEFESEKQHFEGSIRGVDPKGNLLIETIDGLRSFGMKEVKYIH